MTYQVSRNGQMYGPYTREDLERYVASGNVTLTDLAKSEEMSEWLPVSQILGAAPPPLTPAYTTSAGYPAPSSVPYENPPNLNWGLELVLGLFTCGLFVMVWNIVIAAWAKRIVPSSRALALYIISAVLILLKLGTSWSIVIASLSHHQMIHEGIGGGLLSLATWVVRLMARFTLRDDLERHYNGPEPLGIRFSPVMVFFFGGLYFQYKLNEVNRLKEALRYRSPA
jgi:hypothetical protein